MKFHCRQMSVGHGLLWSALAGFVILVWPGSSQSWSASSLTPASQGIRDCTDAQIKRHNPDLAGKDDRIICFEGYVSNFNTSPAITVRGKPRFWATPRWVAHRIDKARAAPETNDRPPSWFTVPDLQQRGIAPTDASYAFSKKFRNKHKNWYERGHLAQKYLLERVSADAAWFTHNVANAVPQRGRFNKTTWLTLECYTGAWANKYDEVWVVTGPVMGTGRVAWLRSDSNRKALPVAVPKSMFKIVLKKNSAGGWDMLSFVMPQTHASYQKKGKFDPAKWFKSISEIERMTRGEFLMAASAAERDAKTREPTKLWPADESDFDPGCKSQSTKIL